jgi:tetratricopeptide (TPR) repeat protein
MAWAIPIRTREFDLDKEEKLAKAEDYAKRAMKLIPTLEKTNAVLTDEQWLLTKKGFMSQAHEAMGNVATKRKDWAQAEQSFRKSLELAEPQTASMFYRVASTLKEQKKWDEAIAMLDQSIARGGHKLASGHDAAEIMKAEILKKTGAAPAPAAGGTAAPAAPSAPAAPEPAPAPAAPAQP